MAHDSQPPQRSSLLSEHPVIVIAGFLAAILAIIAFFSGVGGFPGLIKLYRERQLVGTWQVLGSTATMQFFEDGTLIVNSDPNVTFMRLSFTGSYTIVDGNHIRLITRGLLASSEAVFEFEVSRNRLTLTDTFGQVITLYKK